jgi:trans-2,3-dihydro-3-hydroxyanthranilate isomerase
MRSTSRSWADPAISVDLGGRTLDYHVVDVFTDRAFTGNPLAVVLDGDDLSTEQMQSLAREFNLSETTFPVRTTTDGADYRLRIFTPTVELPFAGHPSVGSAWLLNALGRVATGRVVQECGAGLLPLQVGPDTVTLTGGAPVVGEPLAADEFCAAVGLGPGDAVGPPVRWAGMGIEFAYLHVPDEAVARVVPDMVRLVSLGNAGVSVFSWQEGRAHARVLAGGAGVPEDPATGSAALGLGVWLVTSGLLPADGESSYVVEQGVEMGRPSTLSCTVSAKDGQVQEATVSGRVVAVASGRIAVPAR